MKADWEGDSVAYINNKYNTNKQNTNEYTLNSLLFPEANAATGNPTLSYIKGNYNGLVAKTLTGNTIYVLAVPSIVTSQTGTLVDVLTLSGKLFLNGKTNS